MTARPEAWVDTQSIARLEKAAAVAVPAEETWDVGGWSCRRGASRYVGRVNSASVMGTVPEGGLAEPSAVAASYTRRGLPPQFRLTPLTPPGVASELAGCGLHFGHPVLVMSRPLPSADPIRPVVAVDLTSLPPHQWRTIYAGGYPADEGEVRVALALAAPAPRRFALARLGDEVAGLGLGVVVDGALGVFDVLTVTAFRRRGVGTAVVGSLLAWGSESGCDVAYLQVAGDNVGAIGLYQALGFRPAYTYVYASPSAT